MRESEGDEQAGAGGRARQIARRAGVGGARTGLARGRGPAGLQGCPLRGGHGEYSVGIVGDTRRSLARLMRCVAGSGGAERRGAGRREAGENRKATDGEASR